MFTGRFGRSQGFTFVEVLVVMMTLGILFAIAIPSFLTWVPKANLKAAVRDLKSNISLCKMKAITQNGECVIGFYDGYYKIGLERDGYTIGEESFPLPEQSGVAFGKPVGVPPIPDGAEPGEIGVSFPDNKTTFKSTGRPTPWGTVYLQNKEGRAYALSIGIAGYVRVRQYEGGSWKSL